MKVKVRIIEVLERVVEVEDVGGVEEAVEKARGGYWSGDPVLTADDFSGVEFYALADEEGICPVCGHAIEYDYGRAESDDEGGTTPWYCPHCEATGKEGHDDVFDGHHDDVRDKNGEPVPGRGGY